MSKPGRKPKEITIDWGKHNSQLKDKYEMLVDLCEELGVFEKYEGFRQEHVIFAIYHGMPTELVGGLTQTELCEIWGLHINTLSQRWVYSDEVQAVKKRFKEKELRTKTEKVLDHLLSIATGAAEGNAVKAQELWLKYVEKWNDKLDINVGGKVEVNFGGGKIGPSPFMDGTLAEERAKKNAAEVKATKRKAPPKKKT